MSLGLSTGRHQLTPEHERVYRKLSYRGKTVVMLSKELGVAEDSIEKCLSSLLDEGHVRRTAGDRSTAIYFIMDKS